MEYVNMILLLSGKRRSATRLNFDFFKKNFNTKSIISNGMTKNENIIKALVSPGNNKFAHRSINLPPKRYNMTNITSTWTPINKRNTSVCSNKGWRIKDFHCMENIDRKRLNMITNTNFSKPV